MQNFDFQTPTRIIFGKDTHKKIGTYLVPHAKKILLHYGGSSLKKSGAYYDIVASLKEYDLKFVELGGVVPNPRLSLVYKGIDLCKKEEVDFILAVGGGSVIDSAKAIAMGVYYENDVWDLYKDGGFIKNALPVATILTIPAAGSESSKYSVITNEENQMKQAYNDVRLRPVISIINPELFFTLPKNQIANGVADILSHVFERYFTNTLKTDLTDGLCETVLKTVMKNALLVYKDISDYDAWSQIGLGGMIAHNGLLGLGRETDWASHKMEHELSAIYDVAHGAGLAVITPGWMIYVYKTNIDMFVQFAVNVMGVEGSFRDPDAIVLEGIERLKDFYKKIELPSSLLGLGIGEENLELMAKKATGVINNSENPIGGLKELYCQDVLAIYNIVK